MAEKLLVNLTKTRKEEGWSPKGRTRLARAYISDDLDEKASRLSPHMCGTRPHANVDSHGSLGKEARIPLFLLAPVAIAMGM